ncbi:MAG: cell surface protein SprA, partial [Bacteroidales bacterium]|nr:cell surface protein SprA [Bacteroidales bacterium]
MSLRSQLMTDEVLSVAFEYTLGGKVYQVGEFSTDGIDAPNTLITKLLKGTSFSNSVANWDLMMKNIYSLGASQIQAENFKLDVMYQSDSTGVYINYLPEGAVKNQPLLKVLNLDRLDKIQQLRPDGLFDYVEGYTIDPAMGRIIFPVLEPFGSALEAKIADPAIAANIIFQELYDKTKTEAIEYSEKNKFRIKGEYKSSVGSEIRLNAMNVPQGSVTVTAGGVVLTENIDYTVDYSMGSVTILNQSILESGTTIDVSLESQSFFSMQRKSLSGAHLEYAFNKDFSLGATMMHLSEKPLTTKVSIGDEPMSNTIWGVNLAYKTESQLLTNLIDKLPLIKATAPSSFLINGEFAQLLPGHSKVVGKQGLSYLDDFEASKVGINIQYPYAWFLASTPRNSDFPESYAADVSYGYNRALLSWYNIDPIFTRNTTTTPEHLRNDVNQLSGHFVREVLEQEIFPNRDPIVGQANSLTVLNLSYYPTERGPYNLDATNINSDGSLKDPATRWGGIMRKMEVPDFEAANIEYIEFWMLDPFVYDKTAKGGDLFINLGEISEDILKDGRKSFENGLSINGDTLQTTPTIWGRVPVIQSMVNAFDNSENSRDFQDVGLDGLRNEDEYTFDSYSTYLAEFKTKISPASLPALQNDPYSPLNDPSGDNYHYFRGSDYDDAEVSILDRYKHYNGMEGNSPVTASTGETYTTSATTLPNVEDINQDNNLSEYEKYYVYKVSLRPADMVVGQNFIMDKVNTTVKLKNGKNEQVIWYQFKVPIRGYTTYEPTEPDLQSIRFMRLYMTGFEEETHLRFTTMELVRGDWRKYTKVLYENPPIADGDIDVSVVNIEENSDRKPVNYVLPPGITREKDPSQAQIRKENEQAMSLRVTNLAPGDARAVYKNTSYDMRQFKRFQMFVHAEKMIDDVTNLTNSELTCFVRIGSDLSENYYEYEIPLKLTPPGVYDYTDESDRRLVWPDENMFDFPLSVLTDVKIARNVERKRSDSKVSLVSPFSAYTDPDNPNNKITIIGNPSLGDVQNIMIGVRNQSRELKTGEVWINELRMSDFNEESGYAAIGNATVNLSDLGSVTLAGRVETTGFGSIEDNVMGRRMDDFSQFNVSTNFELGRLFPEKAKVRLPMFYSYSQELTKPKYDAFNQDVLLDETLENATSKEEQDSISDYSNAVYTTKGFNLTNVKVDIKSKTPMFYDPSNFTFGYAYTESNQHNPETERNLMKDYKGSFDYTYSIKVKPVEPFKKIKFLRSPYLRLIGDFNFYYLPSSISYNTTLMRQYNEIQLRNFNNVD